MLKKRIPTAIVLVALILITLFANNPFYWRAVISAAVIIGFWEWLRFCKIDAPLAKLASYSLFGACFYFLQNQCAPLHVIVISACVLWSVLLVFTVTEVLDWLHNPVFKLLIGIAVLTTSGTIIIELQQKTGPIWILCFMASVWAADVGAYFVGKRFGKTKVEGLLGGIGFMLLIYVPLAFIYLDPKAAVLLLLTLVVSTMLSVGGDLFESKMKRYCGLKDSSQILPGHGGVLDRIDSMLSGAPFFVLGLILMDYIS